MSFPEPTPRDDLGDAPDSHGKFSINEDWAATAVGLLLVAAALLGLLPHGIVP